MLSCGPKARVVAVVSPTLAITPGSGQHRMLGGPLQNPDKKLAPLHALVLTSAHRAVEQELPTAVAVVVVVTSSIGPMMTHPDSGHFVTMLSSGQHKIS